MMPIWDGETNDANSNSRDIFFLSQPDVIADSSKISIPRSRRAPDSQFLQRMRRNFIRALDLAPRRSLWLSPSSPRFPRLKTRPGAAGLPAQSAHLPRRWFNTAFGEQSSTIYALSTAAGRAAIAIVRISGPACIQIYKALCPAHPLPKPRYASLRTLYDPTLPPAANTVLDSGALVLYFPAPKTVTGEDLLELHIHGGPAIVKAVLDAIPRCNRGDGAESFLPTIRYAEPGEFTRRAFLNDRLDLPQIEALGNTLSADTEQQRRLAVRGTSDALSVRYERWRQQLLYARGELEALIDFSEDQHFDESVEELVSSVNVQVRKLLNRLNLHVENASKGELLRSGIRVALLGAPNAGKSSLLNRVVGREAAIVSSEEGTTRDIVDVGVDLGGWLCKFGDMAGLRSAVRAAKGGMVDVASSVIGEIEKEGIRRAKARALESDVVVVVLSLEDVEGGGSRLFIEPEVVEAVRSCLELEKRVLVAVNKTDKLSLEGGESLSSQYTQEILSIFPDLTKEQIFPISCKDAQNLESEKRDPGNIQSLLSGLMHTFKEMSRPSESEGEGDEQIDKSYWEDSLGVTHRQSSNLQMCAQHLHDFLSQTDANTHLDFPPKTPTTPADANANYAHGNGNNNNNNDKSTHRQVNGQMVVEDEIDIVTAAEHLRFAADCLAKVTGRGEGGDVESVLGVVFEK